MRNKIKEFFSRFGQKHLIADVDQLSKSEAKSCLDQISRWTDDLIEEQKRAWRERPSTSSFEPLKSCVIAPKQTCQHHPKTAVIILAGGQGSRLGASGPKGCFPILGKSLFEWHSEKIRSLPVAVMTSSLNHAETVAFFERRHFFGLPQVRFFSQDTMPLLDESGLWFWQAPGQIAEGSDGNGTIFKAFHRSGILDEWAEQKIEIVSIVPIDNPLADPIDPVFLSYQASNHADLAIKCIQLSDPEEPMGRIVQRGNGLAIVEFAELNEMQRRENLFANTGLLAIDLNAMRALARRSFPLHWAWRMAAHWKMGQKHAWKAERFIVDALLYTDRSLALCYPRNATYAPLKDKNSIPQIERILTEREKTD
jgi:UDP-N-acetylglucosamine pyrophosphorylase